MRAKAPSRSVAKLELTGCGDPIEIKLFKKASRISGVGLERHMYHEADHGRIRKANICMECELEVDNDDIVRLSDIGGDFVAIDNEQIKEYWGMGNEMNIISCPSMEKFTKALLDGTIFTLAPYEIAPIDRFNERALDKFFAALSTENKCAVVNVPINSQVRRGVILPSGILYTLYFENEIREPTSRFLKGKKIAKADVADLIARIGKKRNSIGKAIPKVTPESILDHFDPDA